MTDSLNQVLAVDAWALSFQVSEAQSSGIGLSDMCEK